MKIFTASYKTPPSVLKPEERTLIGITLGQPKFRLSYPLAGNLKALAPHGSYFRSPMPVFEERYFSQMDGLGVKAITHMLTQLSGGEDVVLLCFEGLTRPGEYCHRRMFAEWWEHETGQIVPELTQQYSPDLGFM